MTVQAQRRGGGGGGGGDDSDGGDDGEDEADREQNSRDENCRINALYYSPLWLHRWIGTYYNGTIVSCEMPPHIRCEYYLTTS